ncbi:hypothetical protein K432DRAFT_387297 [Lepidopterella palustris CBS 459.81]|uniref:F-box domain-containing protein n=1 Tax=Lepidopterella palustris CBS 459.81 TaxID=1314670 RepID=A0A8E2DXU8_9PEZI|nr:hypothetical protein K432DRAFT_387297 [Lepidopterella palustris CBS 459.81]
MSHSSTQTSSHQPSNLPSLPAELLQEISTYLPPSSTAAFALTTRFIHYAIGSTSWHGLKSRNLSDYLLLLELVARDNPDLRICRSCVSIHGLNRGLAGAEAIAGKLEVIGKGGSAEVMRPVVKVLEPSVEHGGDRDAVYALRHAHVVLALSRAARKLGERSAHNVGICAETLALSAKTTVTLPVQGSSGPHGPPTATIFCHIKPRIVRNKFIFHITYRIVLSTQVTHGTPMWATLRAALRCMDIRCCEHCSSRMTEAEIICKLSQLKFFRHAGKCEGARRGPEYRCDEHVHECGCEVDFEVRSVGSNGVDVRVWSVLVPGGEEGENREHVDPEVFGRGKLRRENGKISSIST